MIFALTLKFLILLKNALVEDNVNTAKKEAQQVKNIVEKVDMSLLKGEAHITWMKFLKPLKENLIEVQNTQDIKRQRQAFLILSRQLTEAIKTFETEGFPSKRQEDWKYTSFA